MKKPNEQNLTAINSEQESSDLVQIEQSSPPTAIENKKKKLKVKPKRKQIPQDKTSPFWDIASPSICSYASF